MSATCHGFVENAWRKEICTNCFRLRDEHEIVNSVRGKNGTFATAPGHTHSTTITGGKYSTPSAEMDTKKFNSGHSGSSSSSGIPRISPTGKSSTSNLSLLSSSKLKSQLPSQTTKSDSSLPRTVINNNNNKNNSGSSQLTHHHQTNNNNNMSSQSQYGSNNNTNMGGGSGGSASSSVGDVRQVPSKGLLTVNRNSSSNLNNANRTSMDLSDGGSGSKPKFSVGGPMMRTLKGGAGCKKGILKSKGKEAAKGKNRKMNVSFPEEVVKVIGYGGPPTEEDSSNSSDEESTPTHPMDTSSIAELMEKNSTTFDEKEFHRLTQKNTNFNSIKTNLLGKTNIEIGPIVGCTGGKSMENSSKPLVSIGTFETRKEPLKIRKKIDEDSTEDELNYKTVETRKFVSRDAHPPTSKLIPPSTSSSTLTSTSTSSLPKVPVQQKTTTTTTSSSTTQSSSSSSNSSTNNKKTNFSSNRKDETDNNTQSQTQLSTTKAISYGKTSSVTTSRDSSSVVVVTNNNRITGQSGNHMDSQSKPVSNIEVIGRPRVDKIPSAISTIEVNPDESNKFPYASKVKSEESKNEVNRGSIKPLMPKSILKNSHSTTTTTNTIVTSTTSTSSVSEKIVNNSSLTNLIIFTEGNQIASKRTSFLRDIIHEGGKASSNAQGVTIVNTSTVKESSLDIQSLEKDSLEVTKSAGVNLHLGEKLTHISGVTNFLGSSGSNSSSSNDSEFDDSLEDSGLDIGCKATRTEIGSESDEKSGSSSDSGNENDYVDRVTNRRVIVNTKGQPPPVPSTGEGGLFISVEDELVNGPGLIKKAAKLSPDSVLFSSASEMSASGSSESIPDSCETGSDSGGRRTVVSTATKRPAPRPPRVEDSSPEEIYANQDITANDPGESDPEVEGVYDDVSNFKNQDYEVEDESIYDDCSTITALTTSNGMKMSNQSNAASATGSYDFGGEHGEDDEPVIAQRSDGIEFIGIRKIDSETFLRERSPSPDKRFGGRRERSSSTSPKARRKVNQFFSTIGKKAGAAFSNSHLSNYTRNKSPTALGISTSPTGENDPCSKSYKRSLSSDEVSASRTQEIYATLTPTSLKFKGLAPVLHKLSKIDLNMNNDKNKSSKDPYDIDDSADPKDKMFKKHNKISTSIKKFLRFGNKEEGQSSKYDLNNLYPPSGRPDSQSGSHNMVISAPYHPPMTSSDESSSSNPSSINPEESTSGLLKEPQGVAIRKASAPAAPPQIAAMGRPPPPPPRVHSLDLLNKVGLVGPNGTVKPARPPPPVRNNKVAPSFTSVFNNPAGLEGVISPYHPDISDMTPPSKPKRKNSVNNSGGVSRDMETSYNLVTNLNLETLKIIANQPLAKISRKSSNSLKDHQNLRWSLLTTPTGQSPSATIHGTGFAFFPDILIEGQKCLVLIQECTSAPGFSAPFQFSCVQTDITFEDIIPMEFIPWEPSDYVKTDSGIKAIISLMPPLPLWRLEDFVKSLEVPQKEKYLALLQAMDYWGTEEITDLLVLKEPDGIRLSTADLLLPSSLVYTHPIPQFTTFTKGRRTSSKSQLEDNDFEVSMKQLLLTDSEGSEELSILSQNDRQILLQKVSGSSEEVQAQLKLFFQLKLFAPSKTSVELNKIRKYRSEQAIQQWLDKERALCMKEAVERSITRSNYSSNSCSTETESITPYKKSYLEFLMRPGNSAKAILEMFVELFE